MAVELLMLSMLRTVSIDGISQETIGHSSMEKLLMLALGLMTTCGFLVLIMLVVDIVFSTELETAGTRFLVHWFGLLLDQLVLGVLMMLETFTNGTAVIGLNYQDVVMILELVLMALSGSLAAAQLVEVSMSLNGTV